MNLAFLLCRCKFLYHNRSFFWSYVHRNVQCVSQIQRRIAKKHLGSDSMRKRRLDGLSISLWFRIVWWRLLQAILKILSHYWLKYYISSCIRGIQLLKLVYRPSLCTNGTDSFLHRLFATKIRSKSLIDLSLKHKESQTNEINSILLPAVKLLMRKMPHEVKLCMLSQKAFLFKESEWFYG